jgi:hypothetical protein
VTITGDIECIEGFSKGHMMERDHLEGLGVDGDNIKRIFKKWDRKMWIGLIWIIIGTGGERCECGNGPSGSIKCGEFLD